MADLVSALMAWTYVNQLVLRCVKIFFSSNGYFLLSLHLVDNYVKGVDELGSDHHVQTYINEGPGFLYKTKCFFSVGSFLKPRFGVG